MGFFSTVFGFEETTYHKTQQIMEGMATFSGDSSKGYFREHCKFALADGKNLSAGTFSMPSVAELRDRVRNENNNFRSVTPPLPQCVEKKESSSDVFVRNMVGEARSLHGDAEFRGAVVQAASQFNFLEMVSPHVTPENGIEGYFHDRTQGPACAIACAAGTAYRNYLVPMPFADPEGSDGACGCLRRAGVRRRRGQTEAEQLNGLADAEAFLAARLHGEVPWEVRNGYIESSASKMEGLNGLLVTEPDLRDEIISRLRISVQEDTAVTDASDGRVVTQTYNSACAVGYSRLPLRVWKPLATTVLDATYEATLLVGLLKTLEARQDGLADPVILLTKVGGGVFRNDDSWIRSAIVRAVQRVRSYGLGMDIRIVHFGGIDKVYRSLECPGASNRSHPSVQVVDGHKISD